MPFSTSRSDKDATGTIATANQVAPSRNSHAKPTGAANPSRVATTPELHFRNCGR
jgi:hypothetical protein